jgi:hypothetical protein
MNEEKMYYEKDRAETVWCGDEVWCGGGCTYNGVTGDAQQRADRLPTAARLPRHANLSAATDKLARLLITMRIIALTSLGVLVLINLDYILQSPCVTAKNSSSSSRLRKLDPLIWTRCSDSFMSVAL